PTNRNQRPFVIDDGLQAGAQVHRGARLPQNHQLVLVELERVEHAAPQPRASLAIALVLNHSATSFVSGRGEGSRKRAVFVRGWRSRVGPLPPRSWAFLWSDGYEVAAFASCWACA